MDYLHKLILLLSGQGLILAFLVNRKASSMKNRLISAYILLFSGILVYWYFSFWNTERIPFIFVFRGDFLFQLFLGPILFLLVRPRLSLKKYLTAPSLLAIFFLIAWCVITYLLVQRGPSQGPLFNYKFYSLFNYFGLLLGGYYLWRSYSYLQSIIDKLLFYCLAVYLVGWLANILMGLITGYIPWIDYTIVFLEIFLFYGTGYFILIKTPKIPAYKIDPGELNSELSRISNYMQNQSPYMNTGFNLQQMSEDLQLHPKKLSQLINKGFGQSFTEFINTHRIDRAKEMLVEESYREATVLEILMECGFNSKSAFNTAFKKYTGQSPLQFKKSVNSAK